MRAKWYILPLLIGISTAIIFYSKEYYFFTDNIRKIDLATLETTKTLHKFLIFSSGNIKDSTNDKEIQKLLGVHFGYNLIFDTNLILDKSRLSALREGRLINPLGEQSKIDSQYKFMETLSKKHINKMVLFSDIASKDNIIYFLYTEQGSPYTLILSFPLDIEFFSIQHPKKLGLNAFDLPPLVLTNKFLTDEFVAENAIFYNNMNFWKISPEKYMSLISILLIQALLLLIYFVFKKLSNLKREQLLSKLQTVLNTKTEGNIFDKISDYQNDILMLKASLQKTTQTNTHLDKVTDANKKSLLLERQINKEIAKNLDQDLQKITQLAGDAVTSYNTGISISSQIIMTMLTTIKDSTARLLFLRTDQLINTNLSCNIKDCLNKTLILFTPQLQEIECKVDLDQFHPDLLYRCPEITLIQIFNGIFERLLFSMELANGNFINVTPKYIKNVLQLVFENSSLGIHPTVNDTTELVSSCLSVPNWISTKAIAKTINISIEESFILGKGDILTLNFDGALLMRQGSKNETLCSVS